MNLLPPESLADSSTCAICGTRLPWGGMGYVPHHLERCQRWRREWRARLLRALAEMAGMKQ